MWQGLGGFGPGHGVASISRLATGYEYIEWQIPSGAISGTPREVIVYKPSDSADVSVFRSEKQNDDLIGSFFACGLARVKLLRLGMQ